jgi:hypothetical protein
MTRHSGLPGIVVDRLSRQGDRQEWVQLSKNKRLFVDKNHQYRSMYPTENRSLDLINADFVLSDLYHFHPTDDHLNRFLSQFHRNYRQKVDGDDHVYDLPVSDDLLKKALEYQYHQIVKPVDIEEIDENLTRLHFHLAGRSKIFSNLKPGSSNTEFHLDLNENVNSEEYAYVCLYFPGKNNAYLLPTLLAAHLLKTQPHSYSRAAKQWTGTRAKVVCMVTPDVTPSTRELILSCYDDIVEVPYITWNKNLKVSSIEITDITRGHVSSDHVYSNVFTKLHIFDSRLFPYRKVILLDSDLFALAYFDTLFSLDTPAGWLEHRRVQTKCHGLGSWNSDRGNMIRHGEKVPHEMTNLENNFSSDINASLYVVEPDHSTFERMIELLKIPAEKWIGYDQIYKGCWMGDQFYPYYLLPEQNFLTQYFSGQWTSIDLGFNSWCLELPNCFGYTFAGFTVKPWTVQSAGQNYTVNPYSEFSRINNQGTARSYGIQLMNLLLARMLTEIGQSTPERTSLLREVLQHYQLQLCSQPFDLWEPEINLQLTDLLTGYQEVDISKCSFDQAILIATVQKILGQPLQVLHRYLSQLLDLHHLARKIYPIKSQAIVYFSLKQGLERFKRIVSADRLYLTEPSLGGLDSFGYLPFDQNHAGIAVRCRSSEDFRQTCLNLIKSILEMKMFHVYAFTDQKEFIQIVEDEPANLPLYCYDQTARYLKISEIEGEGPFELRFFNFSLSYPHWQHLRRQLSIEDDQVCLKSDGVYCYEEIPWINVFFLVNTQEEYQFTEGTHLFLAQSKPEPSDESQQFEYLTDRTETVSLAGASQVVIPIIECHLQRLKSPGSPNAEVSGETLRMTNELVVALSGAIRYYYQMIDSRNQEKGRSARDF